MRVIVSDSLTLEKEMSKEARLTAMLSTGPNAQLEPHETLRLRKTTRYILLAFTVPFSPE